MSLDDGAAVGVAVVVDVDAEVVAAAFGEARIGGVSYAWNLNWSSQVISP